MPDYQKLYFTLFNALTDALRKIDALEVAEAKALLVQAQQKAEEMYIGAEQ